MVWGRFDFKLTNVRTDLVWIKIKSRNIQPRLLQLLYFSACGDNKQLLSSSNSQRRPSSVLSTSVDSVSTAEPQRCHWWRGSRLLPGGFCWFWRSLISIHWMNSHQLSAANSWNCLVLLDDMSASCCPPLGGGLCLWGRLLANLSLRQQ